MSRSAVGPTQFLIRWVSRFCSGGKVARTDDHSPASSAEVKNECSRTSAPPVCIHGMARDNLFCLFMLEIGNVLRWFLEFTQKQSH